MTVEAAFYSVQQLLLFLAQRCRGGCRFLRFFNFAAGVEIERVLGSKKIFVNAQASSDHVAT